MIKSKLPFSEIPDWISEHQAKRFAKSKDEWATRKLMEGTYVSLPLTPEAQSLIRYLDKERFRRECIEFLLRGVKV